MRAWRTLDGGRLVEGAHAVSTGLHLDERGRFLLSDGSAIEPRVFALFDRDGVLRATLGDPHESALDDYLYILDVFHVRDHALWTVMIEVGMPHGVWRCVLASQELRLAGLVLEG